uniref:MADF domain-containing protein n=1 Tax=Amphimedon queenslandica TaxID=400682 RepID=A0A1X7VWA5_AMPQE
MAVEEHQDYMCNEKLIEAVRSHTCIWQTSSKYYKDLKAKENSWKEISKQVTRKDDEESRKECIRRWKLLRDRYVRECKKVKKPTGTEGPPYTPKWDLYESLSFLRDVVRHRQ